MITKITNSFLVILGLFSAKCAKIDKIFDEIQTSERRIIPCSEYLERIFEYFELTVTYYYLYRVANEFLAIFS